MPRTKLAEAQKRPKPPRTPLERQNAIIRGAMARNNFRSVRELARLVGIGEQAISKCFTGRTDWMKHIYILYQCEVLNDDELIAFFKIKDYEKLR